MDSMSHEHEGPGGVLEWHDKEMGGDYAKSIGAWGKPKAARRKLINTVTQLGVNAVFCFRAKQKIKPAPRGGWGGDPKDNTPKDLGWTPIAGEEFVFEMTINCLLYPASCGVPTWETTHEGERMAMKLLNRMDHIFKEPRSLDEQIGVDVATITAGKAKPKATKPATKKETGDPDSLAAVLADIDRAPDKAALDEIVREARIMKWTKKEGQTIKQAITDKEF